MKKYAGKHKLTNRGTVSRPGNSADIFEPESTEEVGCEPGSTEEVGCESESVSEVGLKPGDRANPFRALKISPLRLAVFCCFFVLFVVSSYKLLSDAAENNRAESNYSELQALVRQEEYDSAAAAEAAKKPESKKQDETKPTEFRQRKSMDFSTLTELNPDICAWIRLDGTNIDYPVVRTDNNDFYLTHMFNREENSSGSIFVDYRNTGDFTDRNTVIYGHQMKNGTMFNALEEYKDPSFYEISPTLMMLTPDGDYLIELICGTIEDGNEQFVEFNFDSEESFSSYVEKFRARSTFVSDVELRPGDRIVSLCTCSYEWANARYMVIGRLEPIMEPVK